VCRRAVSRLIAHTSATRAPRSQLHLTRDNDPERSPLRDLAAYAEAIACYLIVTALTLGPAGRQRGWLPHTGASRTMTQSVLNLINEAFGTDGYARLAGKVGSGAADRHIPVFLDSWRQWALDWTSPEAPPHAIRPYALAHWKRDPTSGLSGLWQQGAGGANASDVLRDQFLRHLLYCDAIALPDPLFGQAALTSILGQAPELSSLALERVSVAEVIAG
jgi:hypothetical protein